MSIWSRDFPHRFGSDDHFRVTFKDKHLRYEEFNEDPKDKDKGKSKDEADNKAKNGDDGENDGDWMATILSVPFPWASTMDITVILYRPLTQKGWNILKLEGDRISDLDIAGEIDIEELMRHCQRGRFYLI